MTTGTSMHIVQIGKYYPPDFGGVETVTRDLAEGLAAHGHRSAAVVFSAGPDGEEQVNGIAITRCHEIAKIASQPISLSWLRATMRAMREADAAIIQFPNILAALAAVLARPRVLLTFWQADVVDKGLLGRLTRPLVRAMLRRSTRILVNSAAYGAGSPQLAGFGDKVVPLPLGIHDPVTAAPPPLPEALANFLAGRRYVLSIGRLVPYKGFDQLIAAAALLPAEVAVVIVGGGPEQAALAALIAARGLEGRVLLAGRLPAEALDAVLAHAAVYAMSSVDSAEAYGVVQVEAMAHGLPIVATQVPRSGVAWVSGDGALGAVVPVRDPPALAAALAAVLGRDDLPALRQASRARYEALFTADRMVARALDIVAEAVAERRRGTGR
jgi:glycosyltransferase involved in cell wall biosynthesis